MLIILICNKYFLKFFFCDFWTGLTRGVFKSSCANAQAHSGQEFPTLTTGGRSIDLIFWEPKSFGCRQQITGGAAFALSDKFLKIKFLKL